MVVIALTEAEDAEKHQAAQIPVPWPKHGKAIANLYKGVFKALGHW